MAGNRRLLLWLFVIVAVGGIGDSHVVVRRRGDRKGGGGVYIGRVGHRSRNRLLLLAAVGRVVFIGRVVRKSVLSEHHLGLLILVLYHGK